MPMRIPARLLRLCILVAVTMRSPMPASPPNVYSAQPIFSPRRLISAMPRVMVIGEFADLSHEAIAFLTRAKDEGGHLTVALTGCAQDVRKSSLLALRCVDRVLELETEKLTLPELMRLYRIEVLVLAKGQDVPEMLPPTVKVKYL